GSRRQRHGGLMGPRDLLADALGRIAYQYRDSARLQALIAWVIHPFAETEAVMSQLEALRSLTGNGAELDAIGDQVGELRYGRSDADYRTGLYFRIFVNSFQTTRDTVISYVRLLTGASVVLYEDVLPAKVR